MIEMLLTQAEAGGDVVVAQEITRSYLNNQPRSSYAFGYNRPGNKVLMIGGLGGTDSPYPGNGISQTVEGTSSVSAYTGTAYARHRGVQTGTNTLWFGDGITNATGFNNAWRYMVITGGDPVSRAACPAPLRHSSVFAAYSSEGKIFRGTGFEQTVNKSTKKCHSYDITANAWTDLPDCPIDVWGASAQHYNGKIYVMFGRSDSLSKNINTIQIFDTATNTWSQSVPLNADYFPNGTAFGESVIVDNIIWYFTHRQAMPVASDANTMAIVKYNTTTNTFTYFSTKQPMRYSAPAIYDVSQNEVKVHSGCPVAPTAGDFLTIARYNTTLVFKAK